MASGSSGQGQWRVMTEAERREHLRMGGRIAEWLRSLGEQQM